MQSQALVPYAEGRRRRGRTVGEAAFAEATAHVHRAPRRPRRPGRRWLRGAAALASVLLLGLVFAFIPFARQDRLGHLIYVESEVPVAEARARLGRLGIPEGQVVRAPHPVQPVERFVILLPDDEGDEAARLTEALRRDAAFGMARPVVLQETVERSYVDDLISRLPDPWPERLRGTAMQFERRRFATLAREQVHAWMDTERDVYTLSWAPPEEAPRFYLTAEAQQPQRAAPTQRQAWTREVERLHRAMQLLKPTDAREAQALALLQALTDSLQLQIDAGP